ncbi:hypothetical protein O181_065196 [Austropuccinia psidii MF-1]|uniref:Uncharacterized protein n=1 Tax=Austropuccinia psidii MF-1 TaxID=1389203 RepID=A0A9Q3ENH0_9BASI|nr:hypothetical protein [Austropuccinia psidii MF-1]
MFYSILIDSGATSSFMARKFVHKYSLTISELPEKIPLINLDSSESPSFFVTPHTPGKISRQSSAIDFTLHRGHYKVLLQSLPSQHPSDTPNHPYTCVVPSQHACDTANHPYACVEPSQHASKTTYYTYTCRVPSRHGSNTAYHPYTCVVASQHGSKTTLTLA